MSMATLQQGENPFTKIIGVCNVYPESALSKTSTAGIDIYIHRSLSGIWKSHLRTDFADLGFQARSLSESQKGSTKPLATSSNCLVQKPALRHTWVKFSLNSIEYDSSFLGSVPEKITVPSSRNSLQSTGMITLIDSDDSATVSFTPISSSTLLSLASRWSKIYSDPSNVSAKYPLLQRNILVHFVKFRARENNSSTKRT